MCVYHASSRAFLGLFNSCQSFGSYKRGQRVSSHLRRLLSRLNIKYLGIQRTIVQKKNSLRFGLFFSPSFFTSSILKLLKSYFPRTSMIMVDVRNIKILEMAMEQFFLPYFGNGLLATLRWPVINCDRNSVRTHLGHISNAPRKHLRHTPD